jgi:two-component system heavy metal sensor histidine kinase CusS
VRLDPNDVPVELRELVESFNRMIGRLEEGFERLSHFSSDIAHELRTPLTNLITQTQVGLSKPRDAQVYRELLYSGLEEQERLAKMVADMLWLAKSDNDLVKPALSTLDLAWEVRELFDYFEALATENNIELVLEGKVPTIRGDRALIRRALSNLLSNAIRHTPSGETVQVRLVDEDSHVSVAVINPGDTIPAKHLARLFERFYRVDPSRQRHSEGAGLGLAIAKSIIESHGGHIEARSHGGITIFTCTLPSSP